MVNYTQIPTNKLVAASLVCYLWHLYQCKPWVAAVPDTVHCPHAPVSNAGREIAVLVTPCYPT